MHTHTCAYTHAHTIHTCTHTPSHTLSSPGTRRLTFIQEACHIVGIFKKELKESTEQFDLCPGLMRDEEQDCLSFPLFSEGRAHECWAQSDSQGLCLVTFPGGEYEALARPEQTADPRGRCWGRWFPLSKEDGVRCSSQS